MSKPMRGTRPGGHSLDGCLQLQWTNHQKAKPASMRGMRSPGWQHRKGTGMPCTRPSAPKALMATAGANRRKAGSAAELAKLVLPQQQLEVHMPGSAEGSLFTPRTHQAHLPAAKASALRHPAAVYLPTTVSEVLEGRQHHSGLSCLKIAPHDDLSPEPPP